MGVPSSSREILVVRRGPQGRRAAAVASAILLFATLLISLPIAITPAYSQKAFSGKIPDDLVDKGKAEKGKKLPPPKLREPKCDACKKAFQDLRDALESYYIESAADARQKIRDSTTDEKAGAQAAAEKQRDAASAGLGTVDPGGKAADRDKRHADRKAQDPDFGKLDKLAEKITKLIDALKTCEANCPKKAEKKDDDKPVKEVIGTDKDKKDDDKPVEEKTTWIKPPTLEATKCSDRMYLIGIIKLAKDQILQGSPYEADWKALKEKAQAAFDALGMLDKCPKESYAFIFPGIPLRPVGESFAVNFASDGGKWCTYDNGTDVPAPLSFADGNGEPISYTPPIAMTDPLPPTGTDPPPPGTTTDGTPPPPAKTPVTPPVTPPVATTTDTTPPPPAKPPETPPVTTTDNTPPPTTPPDTPPVTTTDNPPPPVIPDTVFVKAKESVLDGGNTGQAIQGQTIKLLAEKPILPGLGQPRTAQTDAGFDKPPAQCTTGADGGCKIDVPPEDRPTYNLPTAANRPKQNYRIDIDIRKTSGAVFETTRNKPNFNGFPNGVSTADNMFRIGNRTFTRIAFYVAAGANFSIGEKFNQPGSNYEEDFCRDKQPGPPLGNEVVASGPPAIGLPHTRLRLPLAGKGKR